MDTQVSGDPATSFTQVRSVSSSNSSITYIKNELQIATISKDAQGQYKCYAENELGNVTNTVWLYVNCKSCLWMFLLISDNVIHVA